VKAGRKPGSVPHAAAAAVKGDHLSGTAVTGGLERRTCVGTGAMANPCSVGRSPGLAPGRGLPSQHLSMLLVRSYRTFAPLPVPGASPRPSAVCFCGTLLTVTRTGRYPASLAIGEPGLSSTGRPPRPETAMTPVAITSPAFLPIMTSAYDRCRGGCSSAG
jgi:hypothetical protein